MRSQRLSSVLPAVRPEGAAAPTPAPRLHVRPVEADNPCAKAPAGLRHGTFTTTAVSPYAPLIDCRCVQLRAARAALLRLC